MSLMFPPVTVRTALAAMALTVFSAGAALAQDGTGAAPATSPNVGMDLFSSLLPILLLVVIFWLLIFRPQQKRMKQQREMLGAIRRGDTVVTTGGIVGKVTKAVDGEDLEVEIAPSTRVKIVRHMIADVRSKAEPVNDNAKSPAKSA
jgi:preprotein translocase subunit YajC